MIEQNTVATVKSVAFSGFNGDIIDVETDIKAGLPSLQIVGMGNKAIDEARQRVRSAITNSALAFPARKLTVNLAPAELPKDGTHLDLPIALSILVASGQLKPKELENALFVGELALDGAIRPVRGAVLIAETAQRAGISTLYLPPENVAQAQLVASITVIGVTSLQSLFQHLRGLLRLPEASPVKLTSEQPPSYPLIDSIIGQEKAKRALLIAAAGRHNILFSGPPGTGKTLLARTLAGLLPPLIDEEIVVATKLHSLSANTSGAIVSNAPFRSPHHSVTITALIGGGLRPRPGDISLAHKGVLFLDELPEYPRATLEALRQPLEDRQVTLSRLYGSVTYPADVLLAATMNPCPCGYLGDPLIACTCTRVQIDTYQKRISGPLLDRIDLRLTISKTPHEHFFDTNTLQENQHFKVLRIVKSARKYQKTRYNRSDYYNAYASVEESKKLFKASPAALKLLTESSTKLGLSNRGSLRILRVARTIADIEESHSLEASHVAEAIQFR